MSQPEVQPVPMTDLNKEAVAVFSEKMLYATVGLQVQDPTTAHIDGGNFGLLVTTALYAAGQLKELGLLDNLPRSDQVGDFGAWADAMADRYAELLGDVAAGQIRELAIMTGLVTVTDIPDLAPTL